MKQFIDKLIERLEEEHERCINRHGIVGGNLPATEVKQCMEIVNQLAEEHKDDIQTIDVSELLGEQGNDGWIPVSSGRMPEDGVPVEVTVKEDNDNGGYDLYVFESWYQEGRWAISRNRYNSTVIAWKPKDAPYQPKGE